MRSDPVNTPTLVDTDQAATTGGTDHMGRRHAATIGEAFAVDWPWVLATLALLAFVIAGLAGYLRF